MYCEPDEDYYELTVAEKIFTEYKEEMGAALLTTIKIDIEGWKNEVLLLTAENKRMHSEISELDKRYREFENSKTAYAKEIIKQYQREMFRGITINDNVWTIHTEITEKTCPHCGGTHKTKVDILGIEKNVDCPHCSYYGKIITDKTFTPIKREISQITTKMWCNGESFERELYLKEIKGESDQVSDGNRYGNLRCYFYTTEEECLSACQEFKAKFLQKEEGI